MSELQIVQDLRTDDHSQFQETILAWLEFKTIGNDSNFSMSRGLTVGRFGLRKSCW